MTTCVLLGSTSTTMAAVNTRGQAQIEQLITCDPNTTTNNSSVDRKRSASYDSAAEILVHLSSCKKARLTKLKKSVCFDMSRNTSCSAALVGGDVSTDDENENDSNDSSGLWFSVEELHRIRLREANVVKIHRFCDHYMQQVTCLLNKACDTKTVVGATSDNTVGSSKIGNSTSHDDFIVNSPARGLESQIMPCIRQRRKQVVITFLKSQQALHKWTSKDGRQFTPDFQQRALSEHYTKLARPSITLARLLAAGDARIVTPKLC